MVLLALLPGPQVYRADELGWLGLAGSHDHLKTIGGGSNNLGVSADVVALLQLALQNSSQSSVSRWLVVAECCAVL